MKPRDDNRQVGGDWGGDADRDWRETGQRQDEAFRPRGSQMGGAAQRERALGGQGHGPERDDYSRGYWSNDFDRGDTEFSRHGLPSHVRDSWRTHSGPGSRVADAGGYGDVRGPRRGTLGPGAMTEYGEDWDMPTGPRTWGSGVGTGMQGRGREQGRHSDPDYLQWRNEQLERFDDDYESFRRERYGKFAEEFNTWRSQRAAAKSSAEPSESTSPGTNSSSLAGQASPATSSESSQARTSDTPGSNQQA